MPSVVPFALQVQTKIMNEGWASFWHCRIMRELDLTDDEFMQFGRLHSGVCTPGRTRMNPYYVGMKVFEDIEQRLGLAKAFEVREIDNDASFIRSYLTQELVRDLDLYVYALEDKDADWTITDKAWEKVRDTIVNNMTNFGQPYIEVEDGDYGERRELYLRHRHDGRDLDKDYSSKTLEFVQKLWGHPVHLETVLNGRISVLSYDGERFDQVTV